MKTHTALTVMMMVVATGLLAGTTASAQTTYTYTYTGQPLANGTWGPTSDGGTPPANQVPTSLSGTVTLSSPLNPNQGNQIVFPVSWSFGAPTGGITSDFLAPLSNQTNPILTAFFIFSTVNGQIVAWAWSISWNYGYDGVVTGNGTMTSVGADGLGSDSWIGSPESGVSHCGFVYSCDSYSADAFSPGAWTSPVIPPPSNVDVLNCIEGQNVYKVVPVSNSTSSKMRSGPSGPNICALPSTEPTSWQIQVTTNGGDTWSWVTLSSLGLGN